MTLPTTNRQEETHRMHARFIPAPPTRIPSSLPLSPPTEPSAASKPKLLDQVRHVLRFRHYSYRTEQTYVHWITRFIFFHNKRHPREMGKVEVERFLTALAVERHVSAATQNQAMHALLFLYRDVLTQELDWLDDIVPAKPSQRLPTVLTQQEVRGLLNAVHGTPWLIANLLYGAGLRLTEGLRLRVKDVDFTTNQIVVREGKGNKDRITMLPSVVKEPLTTHLTEVRALHRQTPVLSWLDKSVHPAKKEKNARPAGTELVEEDGAMTESVEHKMTELYCFVDDFLKTHPTLAHWRRSPHAHPRFSDAEVLPLALLQGVFGVASLKQTYRLVAANWRAAFPALPTYHQWGNRVHRLPRHISGLVATTCDHDPRAQRLYLIDSKPIPVCQPMRHGRVRALREEGAYFGKSSKGWFFGFKLHILRHVEGRVVNLLLTPGNWDDRGAALALVQAVDGGVTLGDLGYRGPECATELAEEGDMLLITRDQAPAHRFILSQVRQRVETTFSQLWHQFVDRVFSRSWLGLWNTLQLKVLSYNLRHAGLLSV